MNKKKVAVPAKYYEARTRPGPPFSLNGSPAARVPEPCLRTGGGEGLLPAQENARPPKSKRPIRRPDAKT